MNPRKNASEISDIEEPSKIKSQHPTHHKLGAYFTPKLIAQWISETTVAQMRGNHGSASLQNLKICDPSVGNGVFLQSMADCLHQYRDDAQVCNRALIVNQLYGLDLQPEFLAQCALNFRIWLSESPNPSFFESEWKSSHLILTDGLDHLLMNPETYDIILGNPPYLRQESIFIQEKIRLSALIQQNIPEIFLQFSKQADYYVYFIIAALHALKEGGILAFIVSTSWLNSKFGETLRSYFLYHSYPIKLIFPDNFRLIPQVQVHTLILICEKIKISSPPPFVCQHLTFSPPSSIDISAEKVIRREDLSSMTNWETQLLRISPSLREILQNFQPHTLPLAQFAEIKTGIYTGLNRFFYLDAKWPPIRPDPIFLFPIIRNPRNIETWFLSSSKLTTSVFYCRSQKSILERDYPNTLQYILWGEKQTTTPKQKIVRAIPWPTVASVKHRKPGWWALPSNIRPTTVFLRYIYYENYLQPYSKVPVFSDRCFHQLYPLSGISPIQLSLILNLLYTRVQIEMSGRSTLGEGALKFETMTARSLPILDCFSCKIWDNYNWQNPSFISELSAFEIDLYRELGIPHPEVIYQQLENEFHALISQRISKAKNTPLIY